ncbi:MAG: 16S rRNA (guanine(966)-N(2))-methyltransferase RsmD [Elusimicrobia bacterium]|jgi:16S rRNA (guanine966-N2)-methyltransferase|nr:16S rRNA (guanine(966)-N(2))-methyltransferase RsmD [Elusimicrobiota bacterium]
MIRIIAGTKKNRRVFSLPMTHHVKPISVRMRKSLFDILRPYITGSIFLDLYAGVGVVGLEALSRGAQKVVFVDKDITCLNAIKRNIKHLELESVSTVLKGDILQNLSWLNYYSPVGYDIVYMGPPYRDAQNNPLNYSLKTLSNVVEGKLLSKYGIVISQHHINEKLDTPQSLIKFRSEKYGDTIIDFFKPKKNV